MHLEKSPSLTLMPEWTEIEAVVLAWPHEDTDWAPWLPQARSTFLQLIHAINHTGAAVLLLCRDVDLESVEALMPAGSRVLLVSADYNDTWTRDYVFLTCASDKGNVPVEFEFNGWGEKFDARKDNQVNQTLARLCQHPMISCPIVAEGGALEIDENHCLMSTASCLFNPKRNGDMSGEAYEQVFTQYLGARRTVVFNHGHLEGDDTDGHIDTLVRFTPLMGIVMQHSLNRTDDPHFAGLTKLQQEIQSAFPQHQLFTLPLPMIINEENQRLPASYANFLICNRHVIAPIYNQPEDAQAVEILRQAYPNYRIITVDCEPLVQQFGSLHCVTMQIPEHTLYPEILNKLSTHVVRI